MRLKRTYVIALTLIVGVSLATGLVYTFSGTTHYYGNYPGYENQWRLVDSLDRKGLPLNALKIVLDIYHKAKTDKNAPQLVKTVVYRMKYNGAMEEFSAEKNITFLEKETKDADFPAKAILQSVLAEQYWNYLQANRWRFYDRSAVTAFKQEDVSTYDLKALVAKSIGLYQASLKDAAALKEVQLYEFDQLLNKGMAETRAWRPTLYDLLANRALDFFKNSEAEVSMAANRFSLNDEAYLKPYPEFLDFNIQQPADSLELKYYSVKLYQELLNFHKKENNNEALADLELRRLEFIKQYSQNELKDSLYLRNLAWLKERFKNSSRIDEINYLEAAWWMEQSEYYKPLEAAAHQWDRKKAVEICRQLIENKASTRGNNMAANLLSRLNVKDLVINAEEVNDVNQPNRLLVTYKNIERLHVRVVRSSHKHYQSLNGGKEPKEIFEELLKLPAVTTFSYVLPNDKDFNTHKVEVAVPALDYGSYCLLFSSTGDFSTTDLTRCYQFYSVSNLSFINKRYNNGSFECYVLHRQSGQPLANVEVRAWQYTYDYVKREYAYRQDQAFKTDKNGFFTFGSPKNNQSYSLEFILGEDTLFSSENFYLYGNYQNQPQEKRSFLFTDRAIYRPGQSVYFKSILFKGKDNNYEVVAKHSLTVSMLDVNGQVTSTLSLQTNEYGTVAGAFILPRGGLTGRMQIYDGYSSIYISVEEYKRPKFEVVFDTLKTAYKLGDEVTMTGLSKAFAGNKIDGARVSYRVVRKVNYPYWCDWFRPFSKDGNDVEISNGVVKTNDNGEFQIKFNALPDPTVSKQNDPYYSFEVSADVTDLNGETRSASNRLRLGYKLFQLELEAPDNMDVKTLPKVTIKATTYNGDKVDVSGQLTVYRLKQPEKIFRKRLWEQPDKHIYTKEEYYKNFPYDLYDDETNRFKWEKTGIAFTRGFNTKTDATSVIEEFKKLQPGVYCIEGLCKDKNGEEVKSVNYITLFNSGSPRIPVMDGLWHAPLKTNVEVGEKASFIVASAFKNVHCIYDLETEKGSKTSYLEPSMKPFEITVSENERGGFQAELLFVKYGRFYKAVQYIGVPYTNKELDIEFGSFRSKLLPGQQEEWKLIIKNKKGDKIASELLAAMYDASLDVFAPHNWEYSLYGGFYPKKNYGHSLENITTANKADYRDAPYKEVETITYDELNYFGFDDPNNVEYDRFSWGYGGAVEHYSGDGASGKLSIKFKAAPNVRSQKNELVSDSKASVEDSISMSDSRHDKKMEPGKVPGNVSTRKNFTETAFFFPQMAAGENGEVVFKFTIPETLTRWKLMALAHTQGMSLGKAEKECVTQKELMVVPNAPRFLREGDLLYFSGKISNLSEKNLEGTVELRFFDAFTEKDITDALMNDKQTVQHFSVKNRGSSGLSWKIQVPKGMEAVKYRITAKAGQYSDGEEMVLPVLTNRMLVTESLPLSVKSGQTKDFSFNKFIRRNNNSPTLQDHAYTVEFTSNPAWYAVQSLPYLMEYPYECAEQTFSRYYSNALAAHIANSKPKIKQLFETWKDVQPQALLSNLEKNQELKALILEETPWVLQARSESENKKRLGLLFDLNKMSGELKEALGKLEKMQAPGGGWPWFSGSPEDWYITQHIVTGLAHLQKLGVISIDKDERLRTMITKAVDYCDGKFAESYRDVKRHYKNYLLENHLGSLQIQYLYMRSYFIDKGLSTEQRSEDATTYFRAQASQYWLQNNRHLQAMIAIGLYRYNDKKTPGDILKSLKQFALHSEEMGMYWKDNTGGYFWHQAPIERQAMMIEAFDEIGKDNKAVEELKTWLIKNKQTQHWGSTRATTEAIYALLLRGGDWLSTEANVEISLGNIKLQPANDPSLKAEAGTGYFKKTYSGKEINPGMGKIKVTKTGNGPGYGAVYWQYFETLDKIAPHETPLKLVKKLFLEQKTASGPVITPLTESTALQVGDKVKVRIELRSDRDLEYVHLKDMRASGFEPVNVLSGYKYQDNLGYYESTRDAATNFFISYLPKGTYVFEYSVFVSHQGNFSNGISSIQCMYAPEFTSHSEGIRVNVEGKK